MKKLKKILLINWLYFSKEIIEVGDINFLTGKNGAGKSTVIDALQIVLLGETNARNFNQAANEKSQRTLDGYLRADMDENNPRSRRGKDFSSYIACEFYDDAERSSFVCGVMFDCRRDGSRRDHFFIYTGTLPENSLLFVALGAAFYADEESDLREVAKRLDNYSAAATYVSLPPLFANKQEYEAFHAALTGAERAPLHDFDGAAPCISALTPARPPSSWSSLTTTPTFCLKATAPTSATRSRL